MTDFALNCKLGYFKIENSDLRIITHCHLIIDGMPHILMLQAFDTEQAYCEEMSKTFLDTITLCVCRLQRIEHSKREKNKIYLKTPVVIWV